MCDTRRGHTIKPGWAWAPPVLRALIPAQPPCITPNIMASGMAFGNTDLPSGPGFVKGMAFAKLLKMINHRKVQTDSGCVL